MWFRVILAVLVGYLLGAFPTGYLVGKAWGVDVRRHGSGRTGGTNVWRATKQVWPLILTVFGDMVKGAIAVLIGRHIFGSELAAALAGTAALFGHNWSFLLGWRGGAGGMTAGAVLTFLSPTAAIFVVPLALILLYISHYASIGTLAVGAGSLVVLVVLALIDSTRYPWAHVVFGLLAAIGIAWALRPNFARLREGTERRITLWR